MRRHALYIYNICIADGAASRLSPARRVCHLPKYPKRRHVKRRPPYRRIDPSLRLRSALPFTARRVSRISHQIPGCRYIFDLPKKTVDKPREICIIVFVRQDTAGLCKGSTADSDSVCEGSNPSPAAKGTRLSRVSFFISISATFFACFAL